MKTANAYAAAEKATTAAKIEGNFYKDGAIVEIDWHVGKFADGASFLGPETMLNYNPIGRPDGLFVMPISTVNKLLMSTNGENAAIKQALGIEPRYWNGPLTRVDVSNPLLNNPRLPSGLEAGANPLFIRGGYTSGGIPEIVIDPVLKSMIKHTPVKPPGKK